MHTPDLSLVGGDFVNFNKTLPAVLRNIYKEKASDFIDLKGF